MANICTNTMEIRGDEKDIADLAKKIQEQNPELLELFAWFEFTKGDYGLWDDTLQIEDNEISFSYGTKWGPVNEYISLVNRYPRLNFTGTYEESAERVFGKMDGDQFIDMSPLDYYTEYNPDFYEERQQAEKLPYKEFLEYAMKITQDDYEDNYHYCYLTPLIIKRIEKKDLPLFIGKEWCEDELTTKLKGE